MRDATSYRHIAPYYDWIMAHVDYDEWGRHLARLWRKFGKDPRSVLELAAGTCPFAARKVFPSGARVIHSDLSPYMLARTTGGVRVAANALALPFKGPFQVCAMIYDAFNYLAREEDVSRCFAETFRVLDAGGLFIFDITTAANSRRHFADTLDFGELQGCTYIRASRFDTDTRMQKNDFTFFVEEEKGCWRKYEETHQQRIYTVGGIERLARGAGFEVAGSFDGFTLKPGRDAAERVHFVLRKPL